MSVITTNKYSRPLFDKKQLCVLIISYIQLLIPQNKLKQSMQNGTNFSSFSLDAFERYSSLLCHRCRTTGTKPLRKNNPYTLALFKQYSSEQILCTLNCSITGSQHLPFEFLDSRARRIWLLSYLPLALPLHFLLRFLYLYIWRFLKILCRPPTGERLGPPCFVESEDAYPKPH